jgi:hypothetical protein
VSIPQYQPGVCNIGGPEVKRRKQVAQLGATIFIVFSAYLIFKGAGPSSAAIAIIPALIAAVGFVQARKKFCFAYGLMGTFNFVELGKISQVTTKDEIAADRRQALTVIFQSLGLALAATVLLAALLAL